MTDLKDWLHNKKITTIRELANKFKIEQGKIAIFLSRLHKQDVYRENEAIFAERFLKHYNLFKQITGYHIASSKSTREVTIKGKKSLQKRAIMQQKHKLIEDKFTRFTISSRV